LGNRNARSRQSSGRDRKLARAIGHRAGLPAYLAVCEGRQTERNYIHGFCERHGINRANVTVETGGSETSALQLVRQARRRFDRDRDFDAVFVICDRDGQDLRPARELAARPLKNAAGLRLPVQLIVSDPCFELWLLLHFEYYARPMSASEALRLLRQHITDYDKSNRRIYETVHPGLQRAMAHVARLKSELRQVGAVAPNSDMAILIDAFLQLRRM
jgi:RloB-like protein